MYGTKCLVTNNEDYWLWHWHLGHIHFDLINKISSKNLVVDLPNINFFKDKIYDVCQMGKQTKLYFKSKNINSTSKPLELIHIDLFGCSRKKSLDGSCYGFVNVDDHSRYIWVLFLAHKKENFKDFVKFYKIFQNIFNLKIVIIHSDHGGEFVNHQFENFCNENRITHNLMSAYSMIKWFC